MSPLGQGLLSVRPRTQSLLHWRARDLSMAPLTGQSTYSYLRTTGAVTTNDSEFGAFNIGNYGIFYRPVDMNLDGIPETMCVNFGVGEAAYWQYDNATGGLDQRPLTIYTVFQIADVTLVNGLFWVLGASSGANPSLQLYIPSSGNMAFRHSNGISSVTTAGVPIVNGNIVECRCVLNPNGSVFMGYSLSAWSRYTTNAETLTATTAALAIASWSDQKIWPGSVGGTNSGNINLAILKMCSGAQSMQAMRDLL